MPKNKKPNKSISGKDPISQLYRSVTRYVKSNNGEIAIIGGVDLIVFPDDDNSKFNISIRCVGKRPIFRNG